MSAPSWDDLEALFHEALACAPPDRAAFVTARCAGRPDLQAEVEALLRAHEGASGSWEMPSVVPPTRLKAGTRVGPYELLAELGAGGMGEVYRAHDTKLRRDVAIKVLPKLFASDAERLARIEREARALAALNHPNIAVIYGVEDVNGAPALVLELIDGVTLAERLARPIPVTEALTIARQIAEALEAAHEKGIIHRDLKPANIKITSTGVVKVLDFGLAKVSARDGTGPDLSQSPTATAGGTREGMILGTVAYMSPEQARGQVVDKRTDIWAFGCVLYEMLTSRRAFPGDDVSDTLVGILRGDPDWNALPASTPAAIRKLLRGCLDKDRRERLPDIGVARLEIKETQTAPLTGAVALVPVPRLRVWQRPAPLVAGIVTVSVVTGLVIWTLTRPTPPQVVRWTLTPASGATSLSVNGIDRGLAITPDGSRVIYVGNEGTQLFVRALDALEPVAVFTGAPREVFVSPDGEWIGFVDTRNVLKRVAVTGGPVVTLATLDGSGSRGATWEPGDTIIFATNNVTTGLQRVAAAGGSATVLTRPDHAQSEADHLWPEMLPGGRAVLFTITAVTGGLDAAQVAVLDLQTGMRTVLVRGGSHAHYVPSGHLVFAAAGTLRAVPFDLARLETRGTPVSVVPQVMTTPVGAVVAVVAGDGTLAYVSGGGGVTGAAPLGTLVWVDRQGRETPILAPPRAYVYPRLSPDGTRVAVHVADQGEDLWIWDLARAMLTRVTSSPGQDLFSLWTPDGQRLLFSSQRAGPFNLYVQAADGTGSATHLTENATNQQSPTGVSADGTRVVFHEQTPTRQRDLRLLTLTPTPRVESLLETPFEERNGVASPDGRWLVYESNSSGLFDIYVRPFPNVGDGQWQVSNTGGGTPLWARNGRELFYVAPDGTLMTVPVQPRGTTWGAGTATPLVEGRYFTGASNYIGRQYDISPDGQRFLMIKGRGPNQTAAPPSIILVEHWFEELKRLVPTK